MSLFTAIMEAVGFLPQRSIGGFTAMCVVEEVGEDTLEITQHPVQQGVAITDHAYMKPAELKIEFAANARPLSETYQTLLALQKSATPMDVVTGKRTYQNMLISSIKVTTDRATENILSVVMELREIRIVSIETVEVPEREKQAEPQTTDAVRKTGRKSAKNTAETSGTGTGKSGSQNSTRRSALEILSRIWRK